jgi:hypothetical protein
MEVKPMDLKILETLLKIWIILFVFTIILLFWLINHDHHEDTLQTMMINDLNQENQDLKNEVSHLETHLDYLLRTGKPYREKDEECDNRPRYEYRWIGPPDDAYIFDHEQNEGMSLTDICILLNEYNEQRKREQKEKNKE